MKKFRNKISAIFAVACLICFALSCALLVACGGDGKETYTVTVLSPSGKAVEADVVFAPVDGGEPIRMTTAENGAVSAKLSAKKEYLVTVENAKGGFLPTFAQRDGVSTADGKEISFRLVAPETYFFTVTGEAVNPAGVSVFCAESLDGVRYEIGKTDANGKLEAELPPIDGYAFITAPEGYLYDENYGTNCPYRLISRNSPRVTFTLVKEEKLALETPMTESEIASFQTETGNALFDSLLKEGNGVAYSFTVALDGTQKTVYSFQVEEDGEYYVFVNHAVNFSYNMSASNDKNLSDYANDTSTFPHFSFICQKGQTYYLALTTDAPAGANLQFVVFAPLEDKDTLVNGAGNVKLSVQAGSATGIRFTPTEAGKYTFSTDADVKIAAFAGNGLQVAASENGVIEIEVFRGNLIYEDGTPSGTTWRVRFTSQTTKDITVKITREDIVEYTAQVTVVKVNEKLTKYENNTNPLVAIGVNGSNGNVVKGDDGFYHFGNKDGAVVVVKLQGKISPFYSETDFEKLDEFIDFYRFFVSTDETNRIQHYENYAQFLRGYLNYGDEKNASGEYYLKYVNDDGVYPLTDELKTFLERVSEKSGDFFKSCVEEYTADSLWLFSAYYYAE